MSAKEFETEQVPSEVDEIKIVNLMSSADAIMSHWQVSQAFMRMARRSKKKEVRAAFLQAEQQIISDLYKALTISQLNEKRKDGKLSTSAALRERPSELSRLGEYFPLTLLSLYTYARTWDVTLFCEKCKEFVPLGDLRIFELCARHHECVAMHCVPSSSSSSNVQQVGEIDPLSLMDKFRKSAMMRSEDDKSGESKNETFFDHSLYDDLTHNMSTIAQLVQMRSVSFDEEDNVRSATRRGRKESLAPRTESRIAKQEEQQQKAALY